MFYNIENHPSVSPLKKGENPLLFKEGLGRLFLNYILILQPDENPI